MGLFVGGGVFEAFAVFVCVNVCVSVCVCVLPLLSLLWDDGFGQQILIQIRLQVSRVGVL